MAKAVEKQAATPQWANERPATYNGFGDQMYMDMIDRWLDLDNQLEVEAKRLPTLNKEKKEAEDAMIDAEMAAVIAAGGMAALGKNAEARKDGRNQVLREDVSYQRAKRAHDAAVHAFDKASTAVDTLRSRLSGTGYAMRMHGAHLIASSAVTMAMPIGSPYADEVEVDGVEI